MNASENSVVGQQARALKDLLETARTSQCRELSEQAAEEARAITRQARHQARQRVSQRIREERQRLELEVRRAEAEIETERRQRERLRDLALIETGRALLRETLEACWQDPVSRQHWATTAVLEASQVLLGKNWELEHPVDWAAEERDRLVALALGRCGAEVTTKPAADLPEGLRIRHRGAVVDMSVEGLLAHTRAIAGLLLAEYGRARGADAKQGGAT